MTEDDRKTEGGLSVAVARSKLGDLVNRAIYAGERIPIARKGRPVAWLVGPRDAERLAELDAAASTAA